MTISITLPTSLQKFLEEQAAQAGHDDLTAYVQSVLLDLQRKQAKKKLNDQLRQGVRARKTRMTKERWRELESEILEPRRTKAGK